ncbi:DUF7477 domain-containing protein [Tenacibaculum sp.]|uniref:DUF7477 domain-containing protein n=1 Tax=Tenacibaculum sp. TaxID=1906242 RepID=UPI003D108CF2
MRLKYFLVFITLIFIEVSFAQQNHIVILEKTDGNQVYKVSGNFPKDWIKSKWDEGYKIQNVNFNTNEWFVVMNKTQGAFSQRYMLSPSSQQIKDKLKDGYTIQDISLYISGNTIRRFYLFEKISVNPVSVYFFAGSPNYNHSISKEVKDGWSGGWFCKNIKSMQYKNIIAFSVLMPRKRNNEDQLIEYRADFPHDLLKNKKSQGYKLTSITYDQNKKSWCVVMTKKKAVKKTNGTGNIWWWETPPQTDWTWFNYKTQKSNIDDYIHNKGYSIVGLN